MLTRISTAEELDALPVGVIIRTTTGRIAEKLSNDHAPDRNGFVSEWYEIGSEFSVGNDELDDLPAQVVYTPENPE
jgi:hypothetical protein